MRHLILKFLMLCFFPTEGWAQSHLKEEDFNSAPKAVPVIRSDSDFICQIGNQEKVLRALAWARLYVNASPAKTLFDEHEALLNPWLANYLAKELRGTVDPTCPARIRQKQKGNKSLDDFTLEFSFRYPENSRKKGSAPCLPRFEFRLEGNDSKAVKEFDFDVSRVDRNGDKIRSQRICKRGVFATMPPELKALLKNTARMNVDEAHSYYESLRTSVGANW